MDFIKNDAEFRPDNFTGLLAFFKEREEKSQWYTDEDDMRADGVRFEPVSAEPICIPGNVLKLKNSRMPKFTASEEAYGEAMYCPEYGYSGSTQLIFVKGKLIPVGNSALRGVMNRAGLATEGWDKMVKYNPADLSEILNRLMKATKGNLCILEQDEMVRAVNSGRYAIYPHSKACQETMDWIKNERPDATFAAAYVCQDFTRWVVDLSKYTKEILGAYPTLTQQNFTPLLIVSAAHTGTSAVSLAPGLRVGGYPIPLSSSIDIVHKGSGTATERQDQMVDAVKQGFTEINTAFGAGAAEVENLRNIKVRNAPNALKRAMKSLGIPKEQGMEAVDAFTYIHSGGATAYDCYIGIADAVSFIIAKYPGDERKHIDAAAALMRSTKIRWAELGSIPGEFSW